MSILKIRGTDGKVYEILAIKGDKGDPGKVIHTDASGEVLEQVFAKKEEIGSAKEAFPVPFRLIDNDKLGCKVYVLEMSTYFGDDEGHNLEFLGKTIKIKTYANNTMTYWFMEYDSDGEKILINPNANITEDPQSGVCELEITIPETFLSDPYMYGGLYVQFLDNPYTEFEAYEVKGTLWEEIKTLGNAAIVASGTTTIDGVKWYYRKFSDGFAECWASIDKTGRVIDNHAKGDLVSVSIPLPIIFVNDTEVTFTAVGSVEEDGEAGFSIFTSTFGFVQVWNLRYVDITVVNSTGYTLVSGELHMRGRWHN